MKNSRRNHAIDIERGIAIIFVLFGHISTTPYQIQNLFVVFNMPFFFIISGKCFSTKNKSFGRFFIDKVRTVLVPYMILGFALYILSNMVDIAFDTGYATFASFIRGIPHNIKALIIGHRLTDNYYTMWFVMALFFTQMLMYFVEKLAKERWWAYLISSVLFYVAGWFLIQKVQGFVFSLDLVPLGAAFFSIGMMLKCLKKKGVNYSSKYLLLISAPLAICAMTHNVLFGGGITFYAASGSQPVYTFLAAIAISWFIINVSNNIGRNRILEYSGENSLVIYAFNNSFAIPLATNIITVLLAHSKRFSGETFTWIITFFIAWLSCLALAWIYNRIRAKVVSTDTWKKVWRLT